METGRLDPSYFFFLVLHFVILPVCIVILATCNMENPKANTTQVMSSDGFIFYSKMGTVSFCTTN